MVRPERPEQRRVMWGPGPICGVAAGFALLISLAGPPVAQASPATSRVAVLGLEVVDLPARLATQMTDAVRNQISAIPALMLVARDAVSLSEAALSFSCIDEAPACLAQIGAELGADILVFGRVRGQNGKGFLVLQAVDVATGRELEHRDGTYDLAALEDGAAQLTLLLFADRTGPVQGRIALIVLQAGARIYLDNVLVDQAPLAMPLLVEPGSHRLRIVLEGFEDANQVVQVAQGETIRITVNLTPLPDDLPAAAPLPSETVTAPPLAPVEPPLGGRRTDTTRLVGWGLLGGGVLVAAVGGVFGLLTLQTQADYDATQTQARSQELAELGEERALTANILYAAGGILALSGGILLLTGGNQRPPDGQALLFQPWVLPGSTGPNAGALFRMHF